MEQFQIAVAVDVAIFGLYHLSVVLIELKQIQLIAYRALLLSAESPFFEGIIELLEFFSHSSAPLLLLYLNP